MLGQVLTRRWAGDAAWSRGRNRFALAHALGAAGDSLVTVSLAGSLFFSLSPSASRQQVLIYLIVTMLPFVVLAPLIGPAIDRFPRSDRWVASVLFAVRATLAIALAFTLYALAFYFCTLALLVGSKASGVTKQALVPGLVGGPSELVAANARLARLATVAGAVAGAIGAAASALVSSAASLALAGTSFAVAAVVASGLPALRPAPRGVLADVAERDEYRATRLGVLVSTSWAYMVMRVAVGFFAFGTAFALRRESEPPWMYGAAALGYGAGVFAGNSVAPWLKLRYREDRLMIGSIIGLAVVGGFGALGTSRVLVLTFSLVLGGAVGVGRQAFDALAQSRAPFATRGRAFARFETWFQLGWVVGALLATAIGIPISYSLAVLAAGMIVAAWYYSRAIEAAHRLRADEPFDLVEIARRRLGYASQWRGVDQPRISATELVAAIDVVRAHGVDVDHDLVACLDGLRANAVSGGDVDVERLAWAMSRVRTVVADLETRGSGAPASNGRTPGPIEPAQASTTVDDVTVQSGEAPPMVSTRVDPSAAER